jgi:hypothetical protein
MRVSELLNEKQNRQTCCRFKDVEEGLQYGITEDYIIEEDNQPYQLFSGHSTKNPKAISR